MSRGGEQQVRAGRSVSPAVRDWQSRLNALEVNLQVCSVASQTPQGLFCWTHHRTSDKELWKQNRNLELANETIADVTKTRKTIIALQFGVRAGEILQ